MAQTKKTTTKKSATTKKATTKATAKATETKVAAPATKTAAKVDLGSDYLTPNFTLTEMLRSATASKYGISNQPNSVELSNIKKTAKLLQQIRDKYGKPIYVSSGFRCKRVNSLVGGSSTSQHMLGEAADIKATKTSNKELFDCIKKMIEKGELKVGQLIWEYGTKSEPNWVHVSVPYRKVNNILYLYSK